MITNTDEYQTATRRTRATEPHPELVSMQLLRRALRRTHYSIERDQQCLDNAKKALFYGKKTLFPGKLSAADEWDLTDEEWDFLHGVLGVVTEAGELIVQAIRLLEGKEVDWTNVGEESGDAYWYHAWLADLRDARMIEDMDRNIAKLRKRFPEKFEQEAAISRDLDREREVLEEKNKT